MSNTTIWIIEARDEAGQLKLDGPQPESVFSTRAITGMTDWEMSRIIYSELPREAPLLSGDNIPNWPTLLNPNWKARQKTW